MAFLTQSSTSSASKEQSFTIPEFTSLDVATDMCSTEYQVSLHVALAKAASLAGSTEQTQVYLDISKHIELSFRNQTDIADVWNAIQPMLAIAEMTGEDVVASALRDMLDNVNDGSVRPVYYDAYAEVSTQPHKAEAQAIYEVDAECALRYEQIIEKMQQIVNINKALIEKHGDKEMTQFNMFDGRCQIGLHNVERSLAEVTAIDERQLDVILQLTTQIRDKYKEAHNSIDQWIDDANNLSNIIQEKSVHQLCDAVNRCDGLKPHFAAEINDRLAEVVKSGNGTKYPTQREDVYDLLELSKDLDSSYHDTYDKLVEYAMLDNATQVEDILSTTPRPILDALHASKTLEARGKGLLCVPNASAELFTAHHLDAVVDRHSLPFEYQDKFTCAYDLIVDGLQNDNINALKDYQSRFGNQSSAEYSASRILKKCDSFTHNDVLVRSNESNQLLIQTGIKRDTSNDKHMKHLQAAADGNYKKAEAVYSAGMLAEEIDVKNDPERCWKIAKLISSKSTSQLKRYRDAIETSVMSGLANNIKGQTIHFPDEALNKCSSYIACAVNIMPILLDANIDDYVIDAVGIHALENDEFREQLMANGKDVICITQDPVLFSEAVRCETTVRAIEAGVIQDEDGIRTSLDNQKTDQQYSQRSRRL